MKQFLREYLTDRSDEENFIFSVTCTECGSVWKSTPIRFSKARAKPLTEAKHIIAQALYEREHARAFEDAVNEAVHHFNLCPLCKRLVCNHCFPICDDLDMCRTCAGYLQEEGEAVLEEVAVY